jgi:hypothetical protein
VRGRTALLTTRGKSGLTASSAPAAADEASSASAAAIALRETIQVLQGRAAQHVAVVCTGAAVALGKQCRAHGIECPTVVGNCGRNVCGFAGYKKHSPCGRLRYAGSAGKSPGQESVATFTRRSDGYNEKSCAAEKKSEAGALLTSRWRVRVVMSHVSLEVRAFGGGYPGAPRLGSDAGHRGCPKADLWSPD